MPVAKQFVGLVHEIALSTEFRDPVLVRATSDHPLPFHESTKP